MFVVVEDLRNYELKGASPRAATAVNASPKMAELEKKINSVDASPKYENMDSDSVPQNDTSMSASKVKINDSTTSMIAVEDGECTQGAITVNDVSGIEVLDSSVKDTTNTTVMEANDTVNEGDRTADQSLSEGKKMSNSWSQSVRRSATKGIDEYSIRKQEEQERLEEEKATLQKVGLDSSLKTRSPVTKQQSAELKEEEEEDSADEDEAEEEDAPQRNEFVNDEALEMEDYQSCDSIDSELRKDMEENEIPDQGEDLGSEDTDENDEPDDYEDGNDSWLVSDGEEIEPIEEDELLQSTNDEESPTAAAAADDSVGSKSKQPKKATRRRRILDPVDDSDEEENATIPAKSPKRNIADVRRSVTPAMKGENENLTPTKKSVASEVGGKEYTKRQNNSEENIRRWSGNGKQFGRTDNSYRWKKITVSDYWKEVD
uniref:Uncharacterized protein n=1 Tax=Anopheles maculatus TaxID=74869 RepID=A0A182SNX0_9DIPT